MSRVESMDINTLRKLASLSRLSLKQIERLASSMSVRRVKRRETIFRQDGIADAVYLLISGVVRISWFNYEGRRVLVTLLPSGLLLGVGSLFSSSRHLYSCDAFSECTIGALRPETLVGILLGVSFEAYRHYSAATIERVWEILSRSVRGMGLSLRKRLAAELLELAGPFGVQDSRGAILRFRPTYNDLANAIGVSRQKLSECLKDFALEGLVIKEGRRLIVVPARLREVIENE